MSDLLNQDQIDNLFGGDGGFEAPSQGEEIPDPSQEVQVYDFRRPARISKDRMRSLEAIYGLFVKSFEGWLAGRTRAPLHFSLKGLDQLTFGEFQMSLAPPCASFSLDVVQSPTQHAVIDFGPDLAFYLLDRLLGGPGREVDELTRSLTVMERRVVRIVAGKAASQLTDVWREYAELDLMVAGFESIPEMLRAASREDPYLVAHMEVDLGEKTSAMSIALPFAALDQFFTAETNQGLDGELSPALRLDRTAAENTLLQTGVEVAARLPHFPIPFADLASLKVGSLLQSPLFSDTDVEIILNGQTRYLGKAGRSGPMLAVEIADVVEEEPEQDRRSLGAQ